MSVRSALPWPFRWAVLAIVLGFCSAIGLWAFEFGKDIAGLDGGAKEELVQARAELATLRAEVTSAKEARDKAQAVADTAGTLVTAEKATQVALVAQTKQLEAENRQLREDLGFFEKLIPSSGGEGVTVRGLQAELINARQLKWQVVVMQQGPSSLPANQVFLRDWTVRLDSAITAAGARSALYMVWPAMQNFGTYDGVRTSYRNAAIEVDGMFIPAGEAWRTGGAHRACAGEQLRLGVGAEFRWCARGVAVECG